MVSGGGMTQFDDNFFASERQKETSRIVRLKDEKIALLEDIVLDLKHRMADQLVEIERLTAKYNEEHKLRIKRRGWLDWIIGYVG
jgi:hypothetical protein